MGPVSAALPMVIPGHEGVAVGEPFLAVMNSCSRCRNLSSASQQTRQKMRECHGLVDSMIHYVNSSLEVGKSEDKVSPRSWEAVGALGCGAAPCLLVAHLDGMVGKPARLYLGLLGTVIG